MKAAVVGAGLMGRCHARALTQAGAKVALVIDQDEVKGRALAARHRGAKWASDISAAGRKGSDIGAVHICTPPADHARQVSIALDARLHCLVEKPLALNAAGTSMLLDKAEAAGCILCPSHQFAFQKGVVSAIAGITRIGALRQCLYVCCTAGADLSGERTALVRDILPHPLSLMRRFAPERFPDFTWGARMTSEGEATIVAESGTYALMMLISTHGRPTRNELVLIGDRGSWHIDLFHGFAVFEEGRVSRTTKAARPMKNASLVFGAAAGNLAGRALHRETAFPGLVDLTRQFYRAIKSGAAESPVSPAETRDIATARDVIVHELGISP